MSPADLYLVAISDHTLLLEGRTALLTCVGYGTLDVEVAWIFNNEIIANSSTATITTSEEHFLPERGVLRESTLQICDIEISNTGEYMCVINTGSLSRNATVQLTLAGKHYLVHIRMVIIIHFFPS